ncbi:MAG: hypothetical protein J6J24_03720 [Clostridia bacterium]|nr:hypothetical protein [Clostridia bacterium]
MKMQIVKHQLKCDFYGCKNFAKYGFSTKGFIRRDIVFCEDCMKKMFECFSKISVPKPVKSPFKLAKAKKEKV